MKFFLALTFLTVVSLGSACRKATTQSTSTPPTTRKPTFLNTCDGTNNGVLLGTRTLTVAANPATAVPGNLLYDGNPSETIFCYVIVDQNASTNPTTFSINAGGIGSNKIGFQAISAGANAGINAQLSVYGATS